MIDDLSRSPGSGPAAPVPDRLRTWERRTEWPLAGAAVLFLVAYAWAVLEPDCLRAWT